MSETDTLTAPCPAFDAAGLFDWLEVAPAAALDAAPFGIIGFDDQGGIVIYNAYEARAAGLRPERVLGRSLFGEVAPCMNNFLVAQRFEDEAALDATLPYTLTLRMRPTEVRLRLLQQDGGACAYVLVQRQAAA